MPKIGDNPGTWLEVVESEHCPICDIDKAYFDELDDVMRYMTDPRVLDYEESLLVEAYIDTAVLLKRLGHG